MAGNKSKITTDLTVDTPLTQSAGYRFDANDRQYIDNQILGCEQHLVTSIINGIQSTYILLDGSSPAVIVGDCVCLASSSGTIPIVTKATTTPITSAGTIFGIALQAGNPGSKILVAVGGMVSKTVTGLASGSAGIVKVDTSTARCTRVSSVTGSDYVVGFVDGAGATTLGKSPIGGGGGGTSPITSVSTGAGLNGIGSAFADGNLAWVESRQRFFVLVSTSTLTVDNVKVFASNVSGSQWISKPEHNVKWATQNSWFLDASAGNDDNTGLTGNPLKTIDELYERLRECVLMDAAGAATSCTITFLTDFPDSYNLSLVAGFGRSIVITGTETGGSSAAIGTVVAEDSSTNTQGSFVCTTHTFDPGTLVKVTAGGHVGAYATVIDVVGTVHTITPPIKGYTGSSFTSGDTVQAISCTTVGLAQLDVKIVGVKLAFGFPFNVRNGQKVFLKSLNFLPAAPKSIFTGNVAFEFTNCSAGLFQTSGQATNILDPGPAQWYINCTTLANSLVCVPSGGETWVTGGVFSRIEVNNGATCTTTNSDACPYITGSTGGGGFGINIYSGGVMTGPVCIASTSDTSFIITPYGMEIFANGTYLGAPPWGTILRDAGCIAIFQHMSAVSEMTSQPVITAPGGAYNATGLLGYAKVSGTSTATTSATYATFLSTGISVTDPTKVVEVIFSGSILKTTADGDIGIRIQIDGSTLTEGTYTGKTGASVPIIICFPADTVTVGSHTVTVDWKTSTSGATINTTTGHFGALTVK